MKRFILLTIAVMAAIAANAQLRVFSDGVTQTSQLKVVPDILTTDTILRGVETIIENSNHKNTYGIMSRAFTTTTIGPIMKTAIGVRGEASYADGMNFGVYGCVVRPSSGIILNNNYLNYGAGIYGTTKSTHKILDDVYAGYFDGSVGISQGLIVSQYIRLHGILLNPAASTSSRLANNLNESDGSSSILESLAPLQLNKFHLESLDDDVSESTSRSYQSSMTRIEKAVLSNQHYGLDADQLEEVFPDLVYEDEDGTKSINYVEMVPILVQAINELKSEIDELKGNDGGSKKAKAQATGIDEMGENVTLLSLGQNKPNPFGTSTNIEVSIPSDVQKAFIYVYDLTGKKLQQIDITARGKQTVTINASSLTDGMYLYSLIADGKVVETRRMIVGK